MSDKEQIMSHEPERRRYPRVREILDKSWFGALVLGLILLSVLLLLAETLIPMDHHLVDEIDLVNEILTVFFIIELFLRWLVATGTRSFLAKHWIDIVAVLPMLRVFRLSRIFQLLRLVRVFSLATILHRRISIFGSIMEGRFVEYGILIAFMGFALLFGTIGLAQFEVPLGTTLQTPTDAFWKSLFSLLEGQYGDYPHSLGGKIVFAVLLLFGMGFFATLTGTISAVMIEKFKENAMLRTLNSDELSAHIVICGFSSKIGIIVSDFLHNPEFKDRDIVIASKEVDVEPVRALGLNPDRLNLLKEDFTHMEVLQRAGITRARVAIILSEAGQGRTTHDIDARTMLAALTIEKLNPEVHTCAEIYHPEYADHLRMGGVDDVVIQGEVSGSLLARSAMQQGLLPFFKDLFSHREGNFLVFIPLPKELVGKDVGTALSFLHVRNASILVGVKPREGALLVNPQKYELKPDDQLLIISPNSLKAS